MREAEEALFNTESLLPVDAALIAQLKARALESPTRRFRLCLHHSPDESVQEMIVVHCRDNYSRPHAHPTPFTYFVLEGELRVVFFDDSGRMTRVVDLAPYGRGKPFALRIESDLWYMPLCLSPQVVFCETKAGPFRRDATNRWAPWSPGEDDDAAIAAYRGEIEAAVLAIK